MPLPGSGLPNCLFIDFYFGVIVVHYLHTAFFNEGVQVFYYFIILLLLAKLYALT